MFKIFKKKSELEKLKEQYANLLSEAHKLSHINRTASDKLLAEAEKIGIKIDQINQKS
ncbi:Lacal_2735 family protein [Algoriphagus sp. CAU 1675]|uniref:Lacal_2735 family protein n=1 Tax=Algoriphagus sp. CAU 1675 TaxID=3032597 RepID=UPI0023DBABD7|nr:Lacal_2735 family protein [Algoriphagus sp. CAU 1675]MDF2158291.1 Lacal_2735 family protein [Algoriphagus sp. CAU 1675]